MKPCYITLNIEPMTFDPNDYVLEVDEANGAERFDLMCLRNLQRQHLKATSPWSKVEVDLA